MVVTSVSRCVPSAVLPLPGAVEGEEEGSSSCSAGVGFKLNTHRALPQLAAALQSLDCYEPCVAEEFGSALPSLIPSVGLRVKERGISSVQSSSCDRAGLLRVCGV